MIRLRVLLEGYSHISDLKWKSLKKFGDYRKYDQKLVKGDFGFLHFIERDPIWPIAGQIKAFDLQTGLEVGNCFYGRPDEYSSLKASVDVHSQYRRKRVATTMYDWVEKLTGEKLVPDTPHSKDAKKFWKFRNR
jgi:hypothetical protein